MNNIFAQLYSYIIFTVSVGFTEENLSLQKGLNEQICLTTRHKMHKNINLSFTLQLQESIEGIINFIHCIYDWTHGKYNVISCRLCGI